MSRANFRLVFFCPDWFVQPRCEPSAWFQYVAGTACSPLVRLSGREMDIASPANTAIAPNTDIAPLFHVFASLMGCSNRTLSSESCISAWSSHKRHQHPSITAEHRSVLPLWSSYGKLSSMQIRLENCLWWLDFTGAIAVLPRCLSSRSRPCHWQPPQQQRTALLLRQNRAEGITTQSSSRHSHSLSSVQVSLLA